MDSVTYQANEKNSPIWLKIEPHEPTKAHRRRVHLAKTLAVFIFLLLWFSFLPGRFRSRKSETVIDTDEDEGFTFENFDQITPSEKLEWHKCFTVYKCARLTVPMDYNRPLTASKDNPKVHIGLILIPGLHSGSEKNSKSPLLLNPGGPGGSGFAFGLGAGRAIQTLLGAPDQDVIGFDPRGILTTTPRADCYSFPPTHLSSIAPSPDDEDYVQGSYHRFLWQQSGREIGFINSSSVALQKLDTRIRSIAQLCQTKDELYGYRDNSILRYVSTPNVARDMLSIVDAWDEWTSTLNEEPALDTPIKVKQELVYGSADGTKFSEPYSPDTKGKLVFWGFSYGTMLGATFASMFPDRVGRLVLDGVVNADGFVGPLWTESSWDTNKNFDSFAKYCHEAGTRCALYRDGDKVKDIENRFTAVETSLQKEPFSWIDEQSRMPISFTKDHLRGFTFSCLYSPTFLFPLLALVVNSLHEGIIDALIKMLAGNPQYFNSQPFCGVPLSRTLYPADEAGLAVMCSDKKHPLNETLPNLESEFEKLSNMSYFSDIYMSFILSCDGFNIKNKGLTMNWDDNPKHESDPLKTSFPILFLSNSADPVTPLHAGLHMAKKFVDAGLIEQNSEGHCSLAAASKCTNDWIQGYFKAGIVPPHPVGDLDDGKWITCKAEEWPWHSRRVMPAEQKWAADVERITAMEKVQEELSKIKLWGTQGLDWIPNLQDLLILQNSRGHCSQGEGKI